MAAEQGKLLADDLRNRRRAKKKKDDAPEGAPEGAPEDAPESADSPAVTEMAQTADELEKLLGDTDEAADKDATPGEAETGAGADATAATTGEEDPVSVFADGLDLDSAVAQAMYTEAQALPDLAELSAQQMVDKIDGNYDLLKLLIERMSERAELIMLEAMHTPEMAAGGPPAGPPAGPAGPERGAQPPMM